MSLSAEWAMLACMSMTSNVRDLLEGHITLELESIDRLYLNGYVAQLQHGTGLKNPAHLSNFFW